MTISCSYRQKIVKYFNSHEKQIIKNPGIFKQLRQIIYENFVLFSAVNFDLVKFRFWKKTLVNFSALNVIFIAIKVNRENMAFLKIIYFLALEYEIWCLKRSKNKKREFRRIRNNTKITNYLKFDIINLLNIHLEFPLFKWRFLFC